MRIIGPCARKPVQKNERTTLKSRETARGCEVRDLGGSDYGVRLKFPKPVRRPGGELTKEMESRIPERGTDAYFEYMKRQERIREAYKIDPYTLLYSDTEWGS